VVDDILDEEGDAATLGKTAGKDKANSKPTYTSLMELPEAKRFAEDLLAQSLEAISAFGPGALRLREIADFIVHRER
jgi:farnesyl diphosphate synthase